MAQQPLDGYTTRQDGPLFKSTGPSTSPNRIYPQLSDVLSGTESKGEMTAKTNRRMRFALTVQDGKGGVGVDTVSFNVVDAGAAFAITEAINTGTPNNVPVNWNVANTTASPINCNNVDILYSTDGGQSFPFTLLANAPNNGSATVDISAFNTTMGRIKVKCATSIFFDINNANLTVTGGTCNAQGSTLCPVSTVTANSGDNTLDLDETKRIIGNTFTTKSLTISGNQGNSPSGTPGNCNSASFNEYHSFFTFTVSQTGTYTFNEPPNQGVLSLFQTDAYVYNPTTPCGAFTFLGANYNGGTGLGAVSTTLQACTKYTVVVSNFNNGSTVDVIISGPGSALEDSPLNGGTSYTYIAVNTTNDQITKVDANADFRSLGGGTYQVYGVSYLSSINTAAWVGATSAATFTISTCALKSGNYHTLTVSGPAIPPGFGTAGCGGTSNFTVMDADVPGTTGIFQTNGIIETSGTVNVASADGTVEFKAGTSVTLKTGFHAMAGSAFTASIATCTPLLEVPEVETAYVTTNESPLLEEEIVQPIKSVKKIKLAVSDFKIVPNPLSQEANFLFNLKEEAPVTIAIYDMSGQLITNVTQHIIMHQGLNSIRHNVQQLEGGMFLVVLRTGQEVQTQKMVVIR